MKPTLDDKEVFSRIYYYLLDFNDLDGWKIMHEKFGLTRLCDCTKAQIIEMFEYATKKDIEDEKSDM